jgi:acyl-coenzyme A synthetase/AMP-(fatty) acid ligase
MYNLTVEIFQRNHKNKDLIAITEVQGSEISYDQLEQQVYSLSQALQKHGLKKGDCVQIAMLDSINTVVTFLSVILAGGIAVMTNPRAKIHNVQYMLNEITARLVITEDQYVESFSSLTNSLVYTVEQLTSNFATHSTHIDMHSEDPCYIVWSSGTTGKSKGITHCHRSARNIARITGHRHGYQVGSKIYSVAKLTSPFGISSLLYSLWCGSHMLLDNDLALPFKIKKNIDTFKPNIFLAVSAIYAQLASRYTFDIDNMHCIVGGDRLYQKVINDWRIASGQKLHCVYGLGEHGLQCFVNYEGVGEDLGTVMDECEIRIVDENNIVVDSNTVGYLQLKSSTRCLGYWNNDYFDKRIIDGWTQTGDLAVYRDGKYYFQGRGNSDIVKISGQYVNLSNIETVLLSHPGVEQAAVGIGPNKQGIDQLKAFVVPVPADIDKMTLEESIRKFMRTKLEKVECAQVVNIVESLPRTDSGKVSRSMLA